MDKSDFGAIEEGVVDASIPGDPLEKAPKSAPKEARRDDTPRKLSIREAVEDGREKSARKESAKKPVDKPADDEEVKETAKEEPRKPRSVKDTISEAIKALEPEKPADNKPDAENKEGDEVEGEAEKQEPDKKAVKAKVEAPKGWPKEAKELFSTLPEAIQAAVAKREDEVSQGFKEYGEKAKTLKEYEAVIEKYTPDYKQFGVTAPQMVERTLQWLNALRHQDKSYAVSQLKQLAVNFGLADELAKQFAPASASPTVTTTNSNEPKPGEDRITALERELQELRNSRTQDEAAKAKEWVEGWAKDKPHFERVRKVMKTLLESGQIPPKNGQLDLDEAYARAVRADPELYQEMLNEELGKTKEEVEAQAKSAIEAERKKAETFRAKAAGVSMKPNAPGFSTSQKPSNTGRRSQTIRDSIRSAVKEVRGT